MTVDTPLRSERAGIDVSVGLLAWLVLGSLFVAIRLAGVLSIPVGGAELDALSAAWQAHAGAPGDRFVPTLFQALAALSFEFTNSETPMRFVALLASCAVPFGLYRLRSLLSEAGSLAALLILAIDPIAVLLGSTAWVGAFDMPLVIWLLVLLREPKLPLWAPAAGGFLLATAGPIVLPIVVAAAGVRLARQRYPSRDTAIAAAAGVLLGGVFAATSFGFGLKDPVLPPILAFANGFEAVASTENIGQVALLYAAPLLCLGLAACAWRAFECWREEEWPEDTVTLLVMSALSLAWVVAALGSHDPAPLAASAVPFALLLGREVPTAVSRLRDVEWRFGAAPLAGLVAGLLVAEAYVVDWARLDRAGKDREQLIVAGLVIASIACAGILASNRRTVSALFVPIGGFALFVMLSNASNVAFGGPNEPLPSPVSTVQGREIRDIALEARAQQGGLIVLHADLEDDAIWPFRGSGEIVFASRIPPDATVLVWPASEPAPEGYSILDGQWSLIEMRNGPDDGFLRYLRWLTNRNVLKNSLVPVAVYLRTTP